MSISHSKVLAFIEATKQLPHRNEEKGAMTHEQEKAENDNGKQTEESDDSTDTDYSDVLFMPGDIKGFWLTSSNGNKVHIWDYLGSQTFQSYVDGLNNVKPMERPEHMTLLPQSYQLKGAAQIDHCCRGPFSGMILADAPGLGKSLTAILAIHLARDLDGKSLVIVPETMVNHWLQSFKNVWQQGHQMKAFHLKDSNTTATELLESDCEVVVCTYEVVESSYLKLPDYGCKPTPRQERLLRKSPAPLHSGIWQHVGPPWKRVILVDSQHINNPESTKHLSIEKLCRRATVFLTTTTTNDEWGDMCGPLTLLYGHPWCYKRKFFRTFGKEPDYRRMVPLQRFLQAIFVSRPSSILKLEDISKYLWRIEMKKDTIAKSSEFYAKFKNVSPCSNDLLDPDNIMQGGTRALGFAIKAQQAVMHPLLLQDDNDGFPGVQSERVDGVLTVIDCAQEAYPDEKIVISSTYKRFLDILAVAIEARFQVKPLEIDDSTSSDNRSLVEEKFKTCPSNVPLLLPAGSSGLGFDITCASIMIQCEPWWNLNEQLLTISRLLGNAQKRKVKCIMCVAKHAEIDDAILRLAIKTPSDSVLFGRLIKRDDEPPANLLPVAPPKFSPLDLTHRLPVAEDENLDDPGNNENSGLEDSDGESLHSESDWEDEENEAPPTEQAKTKVKKGKRGGRGKRR